MKEHKQFTISTDSCVDLYRDYLKKNGVHCIVMKRVVNGQEFGELYNSKAEFEAFYEELKKGALPTTTALNPFELQEHFEEIFEREKGDIIHLPLSSGLSVTCENALKAAEEVNKKYKARKVFVVDSLVATHGMAMLVDKLIEMRDSGMSAENALENIKQVRDRQQGWVIMSDLFHLKRGGRISGMAAAIGSLLGIKPIICVTKKGKLAIENKMRGSVNAIKYVLSKMETLGEKSWTGFAESTVYLVRTSESKLYDEFAAAVKAKYPKIKLKEDLVVGPIIGTHLGGGAAIVLFEGAPRLDIEA